MIQERPGRITYRDDWCANQAGSSLAFGYGVPIPDVMLRADSVVRRTGKPHISRWCGTWLVRVAPGAVNPWTQEPPP